MAEPDFLSPLLSAVRDLVAWLEAEQVPALVIGGVAAGLLGRPRITRDVDAVVLLEDSRWKSFLAAGGEWGLFPRVEDALGFARRSRVLLLQHRPSGVEVDVSLGALPFEEEAVARATLVDVGELRIPLPTPEDLIIMKAIAHRPNDLADISGLLDAHPKLDWRRIRRWVGEFAEVLEMPEILTDLEKLLSSQTKTRKSRGQRKRKR